MPDTPVTFGVPQAEALHNVLADALLDTNLRPVSSQQRGRLVRAKRLAWEALVALRATTSPTPVPDGLTVLHVRGDDGGCDLTLYTGGTRLSYTAWGVDDVDAGRGHEASEWRERITAAQALPPSQYRDDLLAALSDPPNADHITGWDPDQ